MAIRRTRGVYPAPECKPYSVQCGWFCLSFSVKYHGILLYIDPLSDLAVGIDPAISEKRPDLPLRFDTSKIQVCGQYLLLIRGLRNHLTERPTYKRISPKRSSFFHSHPVNSRNKTAICNGVTALYRFPRIQKLAALLLTLFLQFSNRCRIDQYFCTFHGCQAGCFGIPLVPADQGADASRTGMENLITQISRCKIVFFIETGVIRDMHFSIFPEDLPVPLNHQQGVVIESGCCPLK